VPVCRNIVKNAVDLLMSAGDSFVDESTLSEVWLIMVIIVSRRS